MTQYQVVGSCAHATVDTPHGRVRQLHFKGALLPEDVPAAEIQHLLSVGLVKPVLAPGPSPQVAAAADLEADRSSAIPADAVKATDTPPAPVVAEEAGSQPDPEVAEQRAEAKAKLDAAGGKPTGRHGQPVWVEYLVTLGYDYDAVKGESKEALQKLAEQAENR